MDTYEIEFICPLTREECINTKDAKTNPFTGTEIHEQCAFGTKDGACSVARLISALTAVCSKEIRYA